MITRRLVLLAISGVFVQSCPAPANTFPRSKVRCPELAVAYKSYTIRLESFTPVPNRSTGVLLKTRINGGPPLRLLLDTGAENITIDSRSASRSGLSTGSDSLLVGAGAYPAKVMRTGIAESVETGDLLFNGCRVDVVGGKMADGIDGVVPLSLFGDFLLRLDLPRRTLSLTPYPEPGSNPVAWTVPAGDLLLTKATLNEAHEGYVLLDTGAAYTAVSREVARMLRSSLVSFLEMRGANGAVAGEVLASAVRFQVAGRRFTADRVVAMDLTTMGAYNGVQVIGVLGYPDLRTSVLTISYRDALVRLARSNYDRSGAE